MRDDITPNPARQDQAEPTPTLPEAQDPGRRGFLRLAGGTAGGRP